MSGGIAQPIQSTAAALDAERTRLDVISEIWRQFVATSVMTFSHLHDTTLTTTALQGYAVSGTLVFLKCAGPVVIATMLAGLLAGAIQNRFNTASEALTPQLGAVEPRRRFPARVLLS